MDLKPGFKRTEIGIVPEDWIVHSLGDIGTFKNGINKDSTAFGRGSPFVNLMDVFGVSCISSADRLSLLESSYAERAAYDLRRGDVLFVRSSVKPAGVGLTAVVEADLPETVYSGFLIRFRDKDRLNINYKRHCFYEYRFRNAIIAASSVSANTNINQENLKRLQIPLPPTFAEQAAIAEALTDADALIESLEQLLAKKGHIKQGAMQELLTGKKRLPGFSGAWEMKRLGEIAKIKTGSRNNEDKTEDGQYPFFVRSENVERINTYSHDGEAILVPGEGRIGSIFHYIHGRFDVHQRVYAITEFEPDISGRFIHFYLSRSFGAWAMQNTVKATVDSLRLPTFQTFELCLPPTKKEQTAIATVLSDMDAEITALEAKLTKARAIKEGMMQELLTGRIRLI